ncbi:phage tail protein [Enterobacter ludwigii]
MQDIMPPVNTPDNEFHDGDESTGVEGTILYAQYMNDNQGAIQDIQQEMKNVLADAGFTPDPTKENQLLLAIKKILSTGITTGTEGMVKSVNNKQPDASGNVKLGSAADADIVTSMTDTTAGRVPVVGWMGTGGPEIPIADGTDIYKYFATAASGNYGGGSGLINAATTGGWVGFKWQQHGAGNKYGFLLEQASSGQMALHIYNNPNGDMTNPEKYWLKSGILFTTSGGTLTGALTVPGVINTGDYYLRNLVNRHIRFEYLKNDGTWAVDGYVYKDGVNAPNRRPGVRINCGTPDKDKGNTSNSGDWVFGEDGVLTCPGEITGAYKGTFAWADQYNTRAPFYHDFTSVGASEYHPLIKQRARLSNNAWVFTQGVLVGGTELTWHLYMRGSAGQDINHQWDTKGNYNCPGQVIPGNYTNFDSRYLTKSENLPVGIPLPWPTATPPSGWLICNGSAFNKTTCPHLAAAYPGGYLPDLRAQFIRGLDNGKNIDTGRAILSTQAGQSPYSSVGSTYGNTSWNNRATVKTGYYMTTGTDNDGTYQIMSESQAQRETRPTNVAFNYIVRAA